MASDLLGLLGVAGVGVLLVAGLGWPVVARWPWPATERLVAGAAGSLIGVFLVGWLGFVLRWPPASAWVLPVLAAAGLAWRAREWVAAVREPEARDVIVGQVLVTAWCLGWLATVVTYSGGGWAADWYEHWERTRHILARGPQEAVFIDHAGVTARPPLANVVVATLLALTRENFAGFQLGLTFFGSLAFAPAALLARRWGGTAAVPAVTVLFLLNPLLVQNATFAWTKLPAAFFVLTAVYFFLAATKAEQPGRPAWLFSASLAAAILAHYSAGPYAVVLAAAWLGPTWRRRQEPAWWRASGEAVAIGVALLALWFGWALATYGGRETWLANTSVQAADATGGQLARIGLNLRDTLVPHFLREIDGALIAQSSPWGRWRDWFFQCYQVNLVLAFGATGWLVLGRVLAERWRTRPGSGRWAWLAAVSALVLLGVGVHGARDTWGLAHICLQPLVLAGLAALAAGWRELPRGWRWLLATGAVIDAAGGLLLHFGVQNLAFDRWFAPGRSYDAVFATYNPAAFMNVAAKVQHGLAFFADVVAVPLPLVLGGLATVLALGWWRWRRQAP